MKGVSYITDKNNLKKAIVIELKSLKKNEEEIHELIDVLVAESRNKDELISWEDAKKQLKSKGKL
jgi:glutamate synthase domain-containing protein 3